MARFWSETAGVCREIESYEPELCSPDKRTHSYTCEPQTFLRGKWVHIEEQSLTQRKRKDRERERGKWSGVCMRTSVSVRVYMFSQRTKTGPHPPCTHMLRDTWACRLQSLCTRLSIVTESINLISASSLKTLTFTRFTVRHHKPLRKSWMHKARLLQCVPAQSSVLVAP